jgi:hypothetical protein
MQVDAYKNKQINLVSLIRRTIQKVLTTAGLEETDVTARIVITTLVNIAAEYTKLIGDDPKHIEALFHAFLTGAPEEQKAAVKAFGEAFLPPNEPTADEASAEKQDGEDSRQTQT